MSLGAVGAYNVILTQYAAAMQRKNFMEKILLEMEGWLQHHLF